MALTESGKIALACIKEYYITGAFSAADLSAQSNEKIYAATLNSLVKAGLLIKLGGSPVQYEAVDNLENLIIELQNTSNGSTNTNLHSAKKEKNDEFYTRYEDIEAEVMKYRKQFNDKVIYLPCDDPAEKKSEFWSFFVNNFDAFGLKKLIATHYDENGKAYKIWIDGDTTGDGWIDDNDALQEDLEGNGDFRSEECIEILKESDIVITNPPFSMFREFVDWILKADKQFLIIGSQNAFSYQEIFRHIQQNKIWTGYNMVKQFRQPDNSIKKFGNVCWFTNLATSKRNEETPLVKAYNAIDYPKYDNYDAINVNKVVDIPKDYFQQMGVPITFLDKYNPEQFDIIGIMATTAITDINFGYPYINGDRKYARVLIQRKKN